MNDSMTSMMRMRVCLALPAAPRRARLFEKNRCPVAGGLPAVRARRSEPSLVQWPVSVAPTGHLASGERDEETCSSFAGRVSCERRVCRGATRTRDGQAVVRWHVTPSCTQARPTPFQRVTFAFGGQTSTVPIAGQRFPPIARIGCCEAPQRDSGSRHVANLRHRAKHSRHHTKDKQRFVVSVVAYDSLPGTNATIFRDFLRHCTMQLRFGSAMPFDN